MKYLTSLRRSEAKKESEGVVDMAEVEVNEEKVERRTEGERRSWGEAGGDLDPEQVQQGREEEMNDMVKTLGMFDCGSWEEATSKVGKAPTTVKKIDDGSEIVRCRLVERDLKPRQAGPMDDLFAAMPLEAKKALFACVAGVRERRARTGQGRSETHVINVKRAHFNAKCDEEEWVELSGEFMKFWKYAKLKRWLLYGMRTAASGWEDDFAGSMVSDGFQRGRAAFNDILSSPDSCMVTTSCPQPRSRS